MPIQGESELGLLGVLSVELVVLCSGVDFREMRDETLSKGRVLLGARDLDAFPISSLIASCPSDWSRDLR